MEIVMPEQLSLRALESVLTEIEDIEAERDQRTWRYRSDGAGGVEKTAVRAS